MPDELTQARVRAALDYDERTGLFVRRRDGKQSPGNVDPKGYRRIYLDGKYRAEHRLAWLHARGMCPAILDHINGDTKDNRLTNLRPASNGQNRANSDACRSARTGIKGVYFHGKRFRVAINCQGKYYSIGSFDTLQEAQSRSEQAHVALFGEFSRASHRRVDQSQVAEVEASILALRRTLSGENKPENQP